MSLPKAQASEQRLACASLRDLLDQIDWSRVPQQIQIDLSLLQTELAAWRPLREIVIDVHALALAADEATNN
jgi:hypothetical protein